MDVALTLRMLLAVDEVWMACGEPSGMSEVVQEEVLGLFDIGTARTDGVVTELGRILRDLDSAINRAALSRELDVRIGSTPGRLVFGAARALGEVVGRSGRLQFALLLDEFENFSESQQRYVQTLIREKGARLSFLVGARTFGVRTTQTVGGERNREGSEFETIELDSILRDQRSAYGRFCRALVAQRLAHAGFVMPAKERDRISALRDCFVEVGRKGRGATAFADSEAVAGRRCLVRLRRQLATLQPKGIGGDDIDKVVGLLHCPADAVLEKVGVYLFYRGWHGQMDLLRAAADIASEREAFLGGHRRTTFGITVGHFRGDMIAQLLAEYKQKQRYLGLRECVALSGGLPRGLLVVLKHVCRWAVFNGENPFTAGVAISEESQCAGIRDAGRWFFTDQPGIGPYGVQAGDAIERLGGFLRALRFADKPTESSACTVSFDRTDVSESARSTVEHCVESSFLLSIASGHRGRNTRVRKQKLQVHPMLCPRWDLPTGRRGVVELTAAEANAIFDSAMAGRLRHVVDARLARMNAPFGVGAGLPAPELDFDG